MTHQGATLPARQVVCGDCRAVMPPLGPFDMILADPPYGDTALEWDRRVAGWEAVAFRCTKPTGSMWVFGSMRFFMGEAGALDAAGWRYAQDIVWEKHNGSGFCADRFRRVHEMAVHFYRKDSPWSRVFNEVQKSMDAKARRVTNRGGPRHRGPIGASTYESEDGGPRLMRSVIPMRSCHHEAIHPTEKPVGLLEILVRTSCPPGGLVGPERAMARGIAVPMIAESVRSRGLLMCWDLLLHAREAAEGERASELEARR